MHILGDRPVNVFNRGLTITHLILSGFHGQRLSKTLLHQSRKEILQKNQSD